VAIPSEGQIVYISSQISAQLLENAAAREHDERLRKAIRAWLPDVDRYDDHMIRQVALVVRENLLIHRSLLLSRVDRMVALGKAEAL
jgi:hypothetical protein